MMAKRHKEATRARNISEVQAQDLATSLQETRKETAELRTQIDELRLIERKYQKYKEREPEIRHHLGNVTALAK